ncbi:MAG: hypothetical protein COB66_04895 [Coxiella sp. (in: Bacteria)]|nr:MAG: hypothetical protein COB66_04895 [Coxiella sp. (in: g-proteobacteria)]
MKSVDNFLKHINRNEMTAILDIQNVLLNVMQNFAFDNGFKQIMPILMSPITDPLNHDVYPAEIKYEQHKLKLTASMIFHKQLALMGLNTDKILIMAPNIRLELANKKSSSNHLLEFSQFDIEIKDASIDDVIKFIEKLYLHLFSEIKERCAEQLAALGRELPELPKSFPIYSTVGMPLAEVDEFCEKISRKSTVPTFITNFKREFYDKEDLDNPGTYQNFDIVYPEGFGEGLSGAEREYEYKQIIRRMDELDMDLAPYENYLEIAKKGLIPRTAGCGIGMQRLLKYICGKELISDVCLFDRSINTDFIF